MCNDLYLVNQHEIPYIMQKIILKKFDFYRGKKIFFRPYTSFRSYNFRYEHENDFKMFD
jgi:hypothetical protein